MTGAPGEAAQRWAAAHPAVFVCGVARSGTTKVTTVFLCARPFARADGHAGEAGFFRNYSRIDGFRQVPELFWFLGRPGPEHDGFDRALTRSRDWPEPARRQFLLRAFYFEATRRSGAARLVEKTPGNERYADELWSAFPRARFVYVQRHPVDVLASVRGMYEREAAAGRREAAERSWKLRPEELARVYRASYEVFLRMQREMPDAVHRLVYERFVEHPEATMRAAFEFVGAVFDPACLDARGKSEAWGDWEPLLKQPIRRPPSTWRQRLAPGEVAVLQRTLADVMDACGYAAYRAG